MNTAQARTGRAATTVLAGGEVLLAASLRRLADLAQQSAREAALYQALRADLSAAAEHLGTTSPANRLTGETAAGMADEGGRALFEHLTDGADYAGWR